MSSCAVIYNKKPSIRKRAEEIITTLKQNGYHIVPATSPKAKFLLALGGDGTVLKAVNRDHNHGLPILSVRLGRLGFLAEISPEEVLRGVEQAFRGKYSRDTRSMLKAAVYRKGKKITEGYALNDVVIHSAKLARLVTMDTFINNKKTAAYRADGVIVSTATGSTAYNLSAGGPVIPPHRKVLLVTPICPHTVRWRSQVVRNGKSLELRIDFKPGQRMVITFDGQEHFELKPHDRIQVQGGCKPVDFIRFKPYNFQKLLRERLAI